MLYRILVKWFVIIVIVLVGFLTFLLFLGYLLKENEVKTTKLKAELEQEAYQQQEQRNNTALHSPASLNAFEKSQQKIIKNNLHCQSKSQCFVVHTNSKAIGCMVAVNTTGAAILLKIAAENTHHSSDNDCKKEYKYTQKISVQCESNICVF